MMDEQIIKRFKNFQKETKKYLDFELSSVAFDSFNYNDKNVFSFIKGLNKYIQTYIDNNPGEIALVGSSLENQCIKAHIKPILETDIIKDECVSFNKDNAAGSKAFYRDKPFVMDRHHIALIPDKNKVTPKYLFYHLDHFLQSKKYGWGANVASVDEIIKYSISVPKSLSDVYTSLKIQEILVDFIEYYAKRNDSNLQVVNNVSGVLVQLDRLALPLFFQKHLSVSKKFDSYCKKNKINLKLADFEFENIKTENIGEFKGGDSKLTKGYMNSNIGEYPVYSASTDLKTKGVSGFINSFMYDLDAIHVTKNGEKTGTVFFIEEQKHSINGDRAIFLIDNLQYYNKYIYYCLKSLNLQDKHDWGNKLSKTIFNEYELQIPSDSSNFSSLEIQKIIVDFTENYLLKINNMKSATEKLKTTIAAHTQTIIYKTFNS